MAGIAALQRSAGNRAVTELLRAGQAKLDVGRADDPAEREADEVAHRVVDAIGHGGTAGAAGDVSEPVVGTVSRRAETGLEGGTVSAETEAAIAAARGGGVGLGTVRRQMESAFGRDFSGVRLHAGGGAKELNRRVQAKAFTVGNDIFFRDGLPDTGSREGRSLLAHELTHTVQQGAAPTVQREVDVEEGLDKTSGSLDALSGQIGHWSGAGAFEQMPNPSGNMDSAYKYGNTTTSGAQGGEAGSIIGGMAAIGGTVLGTKAGIGGAKQMWKEHKAGRSGEMSYREGSRSAKSGFTQGLSSLVSAGGQGVTTASGFSQVAANAGSTTAFAGMNNLLGGIGGIIALPVTALSTLRTARKAAKQWNRVLKLRKIVDDPATDASDAKKALEKQKESVTEIEKTVAAAEQDLADTRAAKAKAMLNGKAKGPDVIAFNNKIDEQKALVNALETKLADAKQETIRLEQAKDAAVDALTEKQKRQDDEEETPADIGAYAIGKNKSGFIKKMIGCVGGLLGIGGGIAATVASFAAIGATAVVGTAVIATPVGWALCGAAAVIALGAAGYQFWKWASKRYERAVQGGMSKGMAFLTAINPFKKVGTSRRERLAQRLFDYALGGRIQGATDAEQTEAREILRALGLNWDKEKMANHEASSVKVITAKLAS